MSTAAQQGGAGELIVVGAGPGSHDLVSVRGRRLLRTAQVVFHMSGVSAALVAEAPLDAERILTSDPLRAVDEVTERVRQGQRVVWLLRGAGDDFVDEGGLAGALHAAALRWQFVPGPAVTGAGVSGPLAGRCVLVTRARDQAGQTCRRLEELGAVALSMPTISIAAPPNRAAIDEAFLQLGGYTRLILTSANAIPPLRDALAAARLDTRALAGLSICAIGPGTARALASIGLRADLVAEEYRAEGLLDALPAEKVVGERILLFRAQEAREVLPATLRQRGAVVDLVTAYVTTLPAAAEVAPGLAALQAGEVDAVLFTSASTVKHFAQIVGAARPDLLERGLDGVTVAAIGPITADACRAVGLPVQLMPTEYTIAALVDQLVSYYRPGPVNGDGDME